jgi:hypothetical protein
MEEFLPYAEYATGGKYRTKKANTKAKAMDAFVKSLMKKDYSEKYARMAFGKEEKNKRKIGSTRNWKGKKAKVAKKKSAKKPAKERNAWFKWLDAHPVEPPYTRKYWLQIQTKLYQEAKKKKA